MQPNQAIDLLIQSARLAQSKGVFGLEDAALIVTAINVLTTNSKTQDASIDQAEEEKNDDNNEDN